MPNTKTNPINQSDSTQEFVSFLVEAITGFTIDSLPKEKLPEIVEKCLSIFNSFILQYVKEKYSQKDALRLQSGQMFHTTDLFSKYPDLTEKFFAGYDSFFQNLSNFALATN